VHLRELQPIRCPLSLSLSLWQTKGDISTAASSVIGDMDNDDTVYICCMLYAVL
jgi:hypothetical protein